MNEADWLACSDPIDMAIFLGDRRRFGGRKLRLFGCACVRDVWRDLPDDALRQAIETCERFEDGFATVEELKAARELAHSTYQGIGDIMADHSTIAVTALCEPMPGFPMGEGSSGGIAAVAAEARFSQDIPFHVALAQARQVHCRLLREVLGNPFRPVALDLAWLTPTVISFANAAYDNRILPAGTLDNAYFAILANALEEAGCTNLDIIRHCRQEEEHVRGCWVVDLIQGKK